MRTQWRIDPIDGCAYTWADFQAFYVGTYSKKEVEAYWKQCKEPPSFRGARRSGNQLFRRPDLRVAFGKVLNVLDESFLLESQLASVLSMGESSEFRWWAGRCMLDFKSQEGRSFSFTSPWTALAPIVDVLVAVAKKTMPPGEELALIQLILNYYPDGTSRVRSHRHRCRQVCISLGASRKIEVDGQLMTMHHGDCLPLFGEEHAVPASSSSEAPRMSICLFYSSQSEYFAGAGVLANGSFWWSHPKEDEQVSANEWSETGTKGRPGRWMTMAQFTGS